MRVQVRTLLAGGLVVFAAVAASACGQIGMLQARMAIKDAHAAYQAQDYRRAAEKYAEAIEADPEEVPAAYFYLANSYDNLYRPSRKGEAENDEFLTKAIENYRLAADKLAEDPQLRRLSLQYLVAAYGPDKLNDPSQAEPVLLKMIETEPNEPTNYFELGKLYEDSGVYDQAEAMFLKAREVRPNDSGVYMQLAGYYNRQGEFDKTMEALHERAKIEPNNPEAHYYIANYYWDKVFRDFRLSEKEKRQFITQGLESVDKAMDLKPDYIEAITYRGLLLRSEALIERSPDRQKTLLREAEELQGRAAELQRKQVSGVG